jgi:hypothetical protein
MKHWDLTPKQHVTLIRQDGHKLPAQFLFRDTVRACFQVLDQEQCGEFLQFQLMDDGTLKDSPTQQLLGMNFARALARCKRWEIR